MSSTRPLKNHKKRIINLAMTKARKMIESAEAKPGKDLTLPATTRYIFALLELIETNCKELGRGRAGSIYNIYKLEILTFMDRLENLAQQQYLMESGVDDEK